MTGRHDWTKFIQREVKRGQKKTENVLLTLLQTNVFTEAAFIFTLQELRVVITSRRGRKQS